MLKNLFNPNISPYPSELQEFMEDEQNCTEQNLKIIRDINEIVLVDKENDEMVVRDAGFSFQVISMSLKLLIESATPDLSLEFIRIYKLNEYLDLDDEIKRLESLVAEQS
ncbi:hypothetical protein ACXHQ0_16290 [Vibrio antiquarius]|uniref:Uncharacterized protein n=2 Tax=Vibrio parahaemolyticus TaxID=670 RepID=A0AA46UQS5_VIBPH|nr:MULTISPECIES: hypothetical protein [Vibrio harveyi group]EQM47884.1 hypothetical protein D051_0838 [Vibrio parahaemolyticus VPCR-2010]EGR5926703.1 hypothetical protein [Vibrio parahaemolyticus]MCS0310872.1 hypothetical protein [Vibrio diabolicus]UYV29853.1 hypothetical protein M5598_28125 [Vibrio parahaemolyticus]UYW19106.1 hypothetical protein IF561_28170 [Vibrio parahaemolyticus]